MKSLDLTAQRERPPSDWPAARFCIVEFVAIGEEPRYPVESVNKALQLLSVFVTHESIRVKDAAELLGVATGTAHRLLAMLVYRGFVTQDDTSKAYAPGPLLLSVGLRASNRLDLRAQARPYLEELSSLFNETSHVAVLRGSEVLFVDGIESTKTLRVASRAGQILPAHCTSVGKALLAYVHPDELADFYPDEEIEQVTTRSIGTRTELRVELESTVARGYAINFGELEEGIGSVAAPIRDSGGRVVASLGVGAPISRLGDGRLDQIASTVLRVAGDLGDELMVSSIKPKAISAAPQGGHKRPPASS